MAGTWKEWWQSGWPAQGRLMHLNPFNLVNELQDEAPSKYYGQPVRNVIDANRGYFDTQRRHESSRSAELLRSSTMANERLPWYKRYNPFYPNNPDYGLQDEAPIGLPGESVDQTRTRVPGAFPPRPIRSALPDPYTAPPYQVPADNDWYQTPSEVSPIVQSRSQGMQFAPGGGQAQMQRSMPERLIENRTSMLGHTYGGAPPDERMRHFERIPAGMTPAEPGERMAENQQGYAMQTLTATISGNLEQAKISAKGMLDALSMQGMSQERIESCRAQAAVEVAKIGAGPQQAAVLIPALGSFFGLITAMMENGTYNTKSAAQMRQYMGYLFKGAGVEMPPDLLGPPMADRSAMTAPGVPALAGRLVSSTPGALGVATGVGAIFGGPAGALVPGAAYAGTRTAMEIPGVERWMWDTFGPGAESYGGIPYESPEGRRRRGGR